ncbi:excalibur calcium-binding domain-containing protein [Sphingomonas sp. Leaf17]|uniref:excalibur calcium-binding domain-containing protein n=1 Tax=Sphingomonas sp. Leaf17 TaxID=1735683 RepID=UPI0019106EE0|nr:excalibur calcium-binding domain-containing protein [Sphingomonas sp. Leaf17]
MMRFGAVWIAIALGTAAAPPDRLYAHGGGLNAAGCHNDRKNGGYHCHGGTGQSTAPRSAAPVRSLFGSGGGGSYANCSAVRAAGAAPIREGQAGYSRRLDRDGDGVACE